MLVCVMRDRIAANLTWSLILGAPASPRNGDNTKAFTAEPTQTPGQHGIGLII